MSDPISGQLYDIDDKEFMTICGWLHCPNTVRAKSCLRDTMYHTDVILYLRQVFD